MPSQNIKTPTKFLRLNLNIYIYIYSVCMCMCVCVNIEIGNNKNKMKSGLVSLFIAMRFWGHLMRKP